MRLIGPPPLATLEILGYRYSSFAAFIITRKPSSARASHPPKEKNRASCERNEILLCEKWLRFDEFAKMYPEAYLWHRRNRSRFLPATSYYHHPGLVRKQLFLRIFNFNFIFFSHQISQAVSVQLEHRHLHAVLVLPLPLLQHAEELQHRSRRHPRGPVAHALRRVDPAADPAGAEHRVGFSGTGLFVDDPKVRNY